MILELDLEGGILGVAANNRKNPTCVSAFQMEGIPIVFLES